jgi:hypothetical protein
MKAPDTKTYGITAHHLEHMPEWEGYKVDPRVIYVDPDGRPHHALITTVHSMLASDPTKPWCVNLVYVTDDLTKTDPYGLQLERKTSVSHESMGGANGNFFRTV